MSLIVFLIINRGWFGLFSQLFSLGRLHIGSFEFGGLAGALGAATYVWAISALFLPFLHPRPIPLVDRLLWSVALSLGMAGVVTMVLSIFNVLYATTLCVVFGVVGILIVSSTVLTSSWGRTKEWWLDRPRRPSRAGWRLPRSWTALLLGYLVVASMTILFHSATTPVYDYDALIYHDAVAKILVSHHGMPLITGPSPGLEMSANYPPLYPSLGAFLLLFAHGNDIPLRLLAAVAGILSAAAAYAIGRRVRGPGVGLLAAAFTLTAQIVSVYSVYGTVYTLMGYLIAMAFLALVTFLGERSMGSLALMGGCLGLVFLCSYQAVVYLVWFPAIGWVLWKSYRPEYRAVRDGLLAALVPLVMIGSIWYLRNWVVLGNPVYPWLYRIFGGVNLDSPMRVLAQRSVTEVARSLAFGTTPSDKVVGYSHLLLFNRNLFPILSPLAILGAGVAALSTQKGSAQRTALWLIAACAIAPVLLLLASGTFFLRYFIPALPIAAVLPAYLFEWLAVPRRRVGRRVHSRVKTRLPTTVLASILLFPGCFVPLAGALYYEYHSFQPRRHFLASWYQINPDPYTFDEMADDPGDSAFVWVQTHLAKGQRVATYESRLYYLFGANWNRILFLDGKEVDPIWKDADVQSVVRYLESRNVRYVWLSNIVEVGSKQLPLVHAMVGNSPYLAELWQAADDVIYQVGQPLRLGVGEDSTITMDNASAWSPVATVDGTPAREVTATIRPSGDHFDPAGVFVHNGSQSGYVSFQYKSTRPNSTGDSLAVDTWTGSPNPWQRLESWSLQRSGWSTGVVWVNGGHAFGNSRLGFRTSGEPVYVRGFHFTPVAGANAHFELLGSWLPESRNGDVYAVGTRAISPESVKYQFADVQIQLGHNDHPYVSLSYLDPAGVVNIAEKVGRSEVPIGSILGGGTGRPSSVQLPLLPSSVATGSAYLIFNTNGNPFAIRSITPLSETSLTQGWRPLPTVYEGTWKTAVIADSIAAVADRGNGSWTDVRIEPVGGRPAFWRLAFIDAKHGTLTVNSLDAHNGWHEIATATTAGTYKVRYLDISNAARFRRSDGTYYLVLDTKGTAFPILGLQQLPH